MKALCAVSAAAALAAAGFAHADPVALSDAELANVAAGYYETPLSSRSAVVVGDGSRAAVRAPSTVALGDDSQQGVRAAALVNAADSSVANGSNIRDDRHAAMHGGAATSLDQSNHIRQEELIAGYVADWQLQGENRVTRRTETFDSEFTGGIIPQVFTFTGTVTTNTTTTETDSEGHSTSTPSSSTSDLTETLRVGRGVALAGEVDVAAGGGGITFSETVDGTVHTTASTTVTAGWWIFKVTLSESTTVDETTHGGISGGVELQPFSLQAKGVICQALVGSCQPYVGRYSSSSHTEETTLFPARLQDASGGRIVMSDGELNEDVDSSVALEGLAQRDARALHAVNAAGSQLANGLNVSRGIAVTTLPRAMELRQTNQIAQRQ